LAYTAGAKEDEGEAEHLTRMAQEEEKLRHAVALAEDRLRSGDASGQDEILAALDGLACFFVGQQRWQEAIQEYGRILDRTPQGEPRARIGVMLGIACERAEDLSSAAEAYRSALDEGPTQPDIRYWAHNNLAYCLITQGRYEDAEPYCRRAIEVIPRRHNAHKNLGLALEGQGRHDEAVFALIEATELGPLDDRAFRRLNEILALHPKLLKRIPGLKARIERCRMLRGDFGRGGI
jgi:tetratricopeptide (TPR) repeat protein